MPRYPVQGHLQRIAQVSRAECRFGSVGEASSSIQLLFSCFFCLVCVVPRHVPLLEGCQISKPVCDLPF